MTQRSPARSVPETSLPTLVNPGLLGSSKEFTSFSKRLANQPHGSFMPLRELVRPYILRRLKTDKTVIADLPDKTEIKAFCSLSRRQAALYEQAVKELSEHLADATGIRRKGLVLSFLMRFKQICNHPSQWLGDGAWGESESGKWARLRDIAEVVSAWTGIPVSNLREGEREKLVRMEDRLSHRVIGQKRAIHAVSNAVRRARAGLQDENKPIGSLIENVIGYGLFTGNVCPVGESIAEDF